MGTISRYADGQIKSVKIGDPNPGETVSNLAWADRRYKEATDLLREGATPEALAHILPVVDELDNIKIKSRKPHEAPIVMMRMAAHQFVRDVIADDESDLAQSHKERVDASMQELATIVSSNNSAYPWRREAPDAFLMAFPQVFR